MSKRDATSEKTVLEILKTAQREQLPYDVIFRVWVDKFRRPTDVAVFEGAIMQLAKEGKVQLALLDGLVTIRACQPETPCHAVRFASRAPEKLMW